MKPLIGGEKSIGEGGYVKVAQAMGTISNQPGHLVSKILNEVRRFLVNYDLVKKYLPFLFFTKNNQIPLDISNQIIQKLAQLNGDLTYELVKKKEIGTIKL
ncbi:MAG: hypothetical protein H0U57_03435 [Tatlockia sp.]|nr:hypothetical protein [Tatlockia sp.]